MSQLLDHVRNEIRVRHYSIRTEQTYVHWTVRYVQLYKHVLNRELGAIGDVVRAKRPERLPLVLSVGETAAILEQFQGTRRLMAELLYATGMRIIELLRLRVKDIDFARHMIVIRDGKGQKDRTAILPRELVPTLQTHMEKVKSLHEKDLADGYGTVHLPFALVRKYPNAEREWGWQYVFPSSELSVDPRSGIRQRHHVYESVLQKALKKATNLAGVHKPVHAHTIRSKPLNCRCGTMPVFPCRREPPRSIACSRPTSSVASWGCAAPRSGPDSDPRSSSLRCLRVQFYLPLTSDPSLFPSLAWCSILLFPFSRVQ